MMNKEIKAHKARLKDLKLEFERIAINAFKHADRQEKHLYYATSLMETAQLIHMHEMELDRLGANL